MLINQPSSKGTGDGKVILITVSCCTILIVSKLEIVPDVMAAGVVTVTVVVLVSTIPPSPVLVVIVNPVFVSVDIGFLNPETWNSAS